MPKTVPAKDTEYEALYEVNQYTVTYIVDGEVYKTSKVDYDDKIILPEKPVKTGYQFIGWGDVPNKMPAKDIVLTAEFKKVFKRGDVNEDETINSADVVSVYNFIINSIDSGISFENADVSKDGVVNSSDVVEIYNIIISE